MSVIVDTSLGKFQLVEPSLRTWRLILEALSATDKKLVAQAVNRLVRTSDEYGAEEVRAAWDEAGALLMELLPRAPELAALLLCGVCASPDTGKRSLTLEQAGEMTATDLSGVLDGLVECNFHKPLLDRAKNWIRREAAKSPGALTSGS